MRLFQRCGFILTLSLAFAGHAQAAPGPSEEIQGFYDVLLNNMKNAQALGITGRYDKLEPVVFAVFDVPFMSRLSVGSAWSTLTPDKKQELVKAFGRYIATTYATQFDGYSGEQLKVDGEQKIKHATLVKTEIVKSNGEPVQINYVLHDNDQRWQIRDIYLAGTISQLATRRSEFASIMRGQGIDKLISVLNEKADALKH
jgi:phospholipid transport system substrate-binding protein